VFVEVLSILSCLEDGNRPLWPCLEYFERPTRNRRLGGALLSSRRRKRRTVNYTINENPDCTTTPQTVWGTPIYDGFAHWGQYLSCVKCLIRCTGILEWWPLNQALNHDATVVTGVNELLWRHVGINIDRPTDAAGRGLFWWDPNWRSCIEETGTKTGFPFFVRRKRANQGPHCMARRLIERGVVISWWGQYSFFEKTFTPVSACSYWRIPAVSAVQRGLESRPTIAKTMKKTGVSVEQVVFASPSLSDADIWSLLFWCMASPLNRARTMMRWNVKRQNDGPWLFTVLLFAPFCGNRHSPIRYWTLEAFWHHSRDVLRFCFAENDVISPIQRAPNHEIAGRRLRKRRSYNLHARFGFDQPMKFLFWGAVTTHTGWKKNLIS